MCYSMSMCRNCSLLSPLVLIAPLGVQKDAEAICGIAVVFPTILVEGSTNLSSRMKLNARETLMRVLTTREALMSVTYNQLFQYSRHSK